MRNGFHQVDDMVISKSEDPKFLTLPQWLHTADEVVLAPEFPQVRQSFQRPVCVLP